MFAIISLVIILLTVPVTLFEAQNIQDPRQEAAQAGTTVIVDTADQPCPVPPDSIDPDQEYIPPEEDYTPDDGYIPPDDSENPDYEEDSTPPDYDEEDVEEDDSDEPREDERESESPFDIYKRLRDRILERFNLKQPETPKNRISFPDEFPFNDNESDTPDGDLGKKIQQDVQDKLNKKTTPRTGQKNNQKLNDDIRNNVRSRLQQSQNQRNQQNAQRNLRDDIRSRIPTPRTSRGNQNNQQDLGNDIRNNVRSKVPSNSNDPRESSTRSNTQKTVNDRLREAGIQSTDGSIRTQAEPCEPTPEPDYVYEDGVWYPYPLDPNIPKEDYYIKDGIAYPPDINPDGSPKKTRPTGTPRPITFAPTQPPATRYTFPTATPPSDLPPVDQPFGPQSVSILNYNSIIDCYSDTSSARSCDTTKRAQADLNNDGKVNQLDYNIFLVRLRQSTR